MSLSYSQRPVDRSSTRGVGRSLGLFASQVLSAPMTTGALVPSSAQLGRILASVVPTGSGDGVLELGPGTGSVSDAISLRCRSHTAVEVNERLVRHMRYTRPHVRTVQADARDLRAATGFGVSSASAVVSGLPWALMDSAVRGIILDEIAEVLEPTTAFSTFAYLHALPLSTAKSFHRSLIARFDQVTVSRTVWGNFPPAIAYICHRPGK